jgi:hypothetical protein
VGQARDDGADTQSVGEEGEGGVGRVGVSICAGTMVASDIA